MTDTNSGGDNPKKSTSDAIRGESSKKDRYRITTSDNPGISLVTKPLNGAKYLAWSRPMCIALGAKKKLGFVNGKFVKPEENDEDFEDWQDADSMVQAWILSSIEKEMSDSLIGAATAKDL